ncbi:MAG: hypothetical protein M3Y56_00160, partial [Armatimonadota bacterium]|nr:hypothetical protein [Armatimonadota bacterium]
MHFDSLRSHRSNALAAGCFVTLLLIAIVLPPAHGQAQAAPFVWLEGESPTTIAPATLKPEITDVGAPKLLSGAKWLHIGIEAAKV